MDNSGVALGLVFVLLTFMDFRVSFAGFWSCCVFAAARDGSESILAGFAGFKSSCIFAAARNGSKSIGAGVTRVGMEEGLDGMKGRDFLVGEEGMSWGLPSRSLFRDAASRSATS